MWVYRYLYFRRSSNILRYDYDFTREKKNKRIQYFCLTSSVDVSYLGMDFRLYKSGKTSCYIKNFLWNEVEV